MAPHAWLTPVDVAYLALAKQVHDRAVTEAEAAWQRAVQVVAKELRVPEGVALRLVEQDGQVKMEWDTPTLAGDIKPSSGHDGLRCD